MNKIILKKSISKKTNSQYVCLYFDLGYCLKPITFDNALIVELMGISFSQFSELLSKMPSDTSVEVGKFDFNK